MSKTGTRLNVDERRTQLLELGLSLFSEASYESISIDDIAARAGVSKGLLYHYFGGKRDFYTETVRFAASRLLETMEPDGELSAPERVQRGLNAYLDFVDGRAEAYLALINGGLGADSDVQGIIDLTRQQFARLIFQGMGLDAPANAALRIAVRGWIGAVEGACSDWLRWRDIDRDKLVLLLMGSLYAHLKLAEQMDTSLKLPLDPALGRFLFAG